MLCNPTQTCFWAGRLTPAIRAITRFSKLFGGRTSRVRRSELEILAGSRVSRKPTDAETSLDPAWGVCPCSGEGSGLAAPSGRNRLALPRALLWRAERSWPTHARDRCVSRPSLAYPRAKPPREPPFKLAFFNRLSYWCDIRCAWIC